jgi:heptosyltransferase II
MAPRVLYKASASMKKRVLIIKLGYCETLVNETGFVPSLGDVFRHTVLLHHYSNDQVTWLTSQSALPLLEDNPFIAELLTFSPDTAQGLAGREFDEVLCLEKAPMLCQVADSVKCSRRLGFRLSNGSTGACRGAEPAVEISNGRDSFLPVQAYLYRMVDDYWDGEKYILGYKPTPMGKFDVGFNFRVGSKWPSKQWPEEQWKELEHYLTTHNLTVTWQKGEDDLRKYMDWLSSSRLIVTCDSLGMHLGLAMQKKVIALFGPTQSEQIYMYGKGVILTAEWACQHAPCLRSECNLNHECMKELNPRIVARTVTNLLNGNP